MREQGNYSPPPYQTSIRSRGVHQRGENQTGTAHPAARMHLVEPVHALTLSDEDMQITGGGRIHSRDAEISTKVLPACALQADQYVPGGELETHTTGHERHPSCTAAQERTKGGDAEPQASVSDACGDENDHDHRHRQHCQ
eukprot:1882123-Rhodomonas_salina.2